jgi:hypothetical protein
MEISQTAYSGHVRLRLSEIYAAAAAAKETMHLRRLLEAHESKPLLRAFKTNF